ncbi:MAG: OmpA family protein [Marinibacterium sp.]
MIRARLLVLCVLSVLAPSATWAFDPKLPPGAQRLLEVRRDNVHYDLAVSAFGPKGGDTVPVTGRLHRSTWKISKRATAEQVLIALRADLIQAGYEPVFECRDRGCGGFDFRFAIDVAPAPSMYVNLGQYIYLAALDASGNAVALLISATAQDTFVQLDELTRDGAGDAPADPGPLLLESGRVVLDLAPPTADGPAPAPVLAALARFLADHPGRRIAIVAHSATAGADDAARAEGLAEARSVRARLVAEYGVDPARVEALWLGPFTPRVSPATEAGRALNRRIEAVLLPDAPAAE